MKRFLIAVAASAIFLGGQTEAAPADDLNAQIETQETGTWAHFRDKHLLGRETENERRDRKDWERRHRYDPPPRHHHYRDDDRYYPPPPYRDGRRYYPPGAPPPPPYYRDGRRYYPPTPPPPPPPNRRR